MKIRRLLMAGFISFVTVGINQCKNQLDETNAVSGTKTETLTRYLNPPVLYYTHSADFNTYYVDLLEQTAATTWEIRTKQISVTGSGGLKSPTTYENYIVLLDSSSPGRLLVYDRITFMQVAALPLGGAYPNEMVILGTYAYISINGDFATQGNAVKVVDLTNPLSPSISTTLVTGNKPANLRQINSKLYLANQDSITQVQATVQTIDPFSNNGVSTPINVGENPSDIGYDGSHIWTYNSKWFGGAAASLTHITGVTPTDITTFTTTYKPAFGGTIAFNNAGGFVLLSPAPAAFPTVFHLFSINGTTVNGTVVDSTNDYKFVGVGENYLFKIHNGDGSTQNLTVLIENLVGTNVTTQTMTKDTDMAFWPAR